ncbi:P68 family surface lipoprotein [Mycoplasmopsis edwardii]|uniref:P80 family lipoprotein n=1 Tax=Mycoplasmopsis edwardii TaxID=53558 RepID=A0ACD4PHZ3_9BACT|nr:P80 family lipoprotein [Mycoplasmopsis edwardii]WBP84255.1 P80 family lipoprotein [Mycoplasmopsis edwardii]
MSKKIKKYLLAGTSVASLALVAGAISCTPSQAGLSESQIELYKDQLESFSKKLPESEREAIEAKIANLKTLSDIDAIKTKIQEIMDETKPGYFERLDASTETNRLFSQEVKDQIVLATTFSESGSQARTIKSILEEYNKLVDQMLAVKNDSTKTDEEKAAKYKELGISPLAKKVVHKVLGSGYQVGAEKVGLGLSSKDEKTFFNLIVNYSTVAAKLAEKDMLLSFNSLDDSINVDVDYFDKGFAAVNESIENVNKKSTYVLPIFKSTQVLAINSPVLGYILKTMRDHGVVFETEDQSNTFFEDIITKGANDANTVETLWGAPVATIDTVLQEYKATGFKLSKSIFDSYTSLLDFANIAQRMFEISSKGLDSDVHVFGIDDMTGVYEQALYAAIGANPDKMLQTVSNNDNKIKVNYSSIRQKDGDAYINSQKIYTKFTEAFRSGSTYAFPSGQYSSNDQTKHKFAFSIGSTAGYFHNFKSKGDAVSVLKHTESKYEFEAAPNFFTDNDKAPEGSLAWVGKYKNSIFGASRVEALPPYTYKLKNADDEQKITALQAAQTSLNFFVNPASADPKQLSWFEAMKKVGSDKVEVIALVNNNKQEVFLVAIKDVAEKGKANVREGNTNLEAAGITYKSLSDTGLLNQNELVSHATPSKWLPTDSKKVLFAQGPSLIGIKSNNEDEDATRAFVKWLLESKKEITFGKAKSTALDQLQKSASYITATADLNTKNGQSIYGKNEYLKIAYEEFRASSLDDNYVVFEEPAGVNADAFRKQIATAWETTQSNIVNKTSGNSFESFVQYLTEGQK